MGDAGEGLVDAQSRIEERLEEVARERSEKAGRDGRDPELVRSLESLRLGRTELERQLGTVTHERRVEALRAAIADLDRRMAEISARLKK